MILTSARLSSTRRMWKSGCMEDLGPLRRGPVGGPGQGDVERRASVGLALDPDPAAVGLDDLLADGEPGAGAFVFLAGVEAAEELEDLGVELGLDADPVVADGEGDPSRPARRPRPRSRPRGRASWLYFRPLPTRFARSWPIRSRSPQTAGKGPSTRISAFLDRTSSARSALMTSTTSSRLTRAKSAVTLPARESESRSWISDRSRRDASTR